jgi:hypothetical protein
MLSVFRMGGGKCEGNPCETCLKRKYKCRPQGEDPPPRGQKKADKCRRCLERRRVCKGYPCEACLEHNYECQLQGEDQQPGRQHLVGRTEATGTRVHALSNAAVTDGSTVIGTRKRKRLTEEKGVECSPAVELPRRGSSLALNDESSVTDTTSHTHLPIERQRVDSSNPTASKSVQVPNVGVSVGSEPAAKQQVTGSSYIPTEGLSYRRLYGALGFSRNHPSRPIKLLKQEINRYCRRPDSSEAHKLARELCEEMGPQLWPASPGVLWPVWAKEESKYVSL